MKNVTAFAVFLTKLPKMFVLCHNVSEPMDMLENEVPTNVRKQTRKPFQETFGQISFQTDVFGTNDIFPEVYPKHD